MARAKSVLASISLLRVALTRVFVDLCSKGVRLFRTVVLRATNSPCYCVHGKFASQMAEPPIGAKGTEKLANKLKQVARPSATL